MAKRKVVTVTLTPYEAKALFEAGSNHTPSGKWWKQHAQSRATGKLKRAILNHDLNEELLAQERQKEIIRYVPNRSYLR